VTWPQLADAAARYAAYIAAIGKTGTQYVLNPAKFFAGSSGPWSDEWQPPAAPTPPIPRAPTRTWRPPPDEDEAHAQR